MAEQRANNKVGHRGARIVIHLVFAVACFYAGIFVGTGQGLLYALGLEADSAVFRISRYETGEFEPGEFKGLAESTIDANISHFGTHIQKYWLIHQIPSPWSLADAGQSFMETAVGYRLGHPRSNEERMKALLVPDSFEQSVRDFVSVTRDEKGQLPFSDEESVRFAEESLRQIIDQEQAYQHALEFVRRKRVGDA